MGYDSKLMGKGQTHRSGASEQLDGTEIKRLEEAIWLRNASHTRWPSLKSVGYLRPSQRDSNCSRRTDSERRERERSAIRCVSGILDRLVELDYRFRAAMAAA